MVSLFCALEALLLRDELLRGAELEELLATELAILLLEGADELTVAADDDTGVGVDDAPSPPPPQAEIDKVSAIRRLRFKGVFFIKHP